MKKFILTAGLLLFIGLSAFCQIEEKNGTIFIKHPNIDVVRNATKAYLENDHSSRSNYFADSAKFWVSGMEKAIPMIEASKAFDRQFQNYDSIKMKSVGYPDYLHYKDLDAKIVQSWWQWSGRSKKTGELLVIDIARFDEFNLAGKIVMEGLYGDFSKMEND